MFDGATDTARFETYVERCLVPTLRPGDIVVYLAGDPDLPVTDADEPTLEIQEGHTALSDSSSHG